MKYGFVYIWYDKKHKRYYVGAHWGATDDGYVCSSPWMKQAYKRRPKDFKRKILSYIHTNKKDMFEEEYRWLSMMKPEELKGNRYYNTHNFHFSHWSANPKTSLSVKQRLTGRKLSPETIAKRTATRMANSGYKLREETKQKMSKSRKGSGNSFYGKHHSERTKQRLSDLNKGKKQSPEVVAKKIATRTANGNNQHCDETRKRISEKLKLYHAQRKLKENEV